MVISKIPEPVWTYSPFRGTGNEPLLLYNSSQGLPPGAGFACHSLSVRLPGAPRLAAALAEPGVAVVNCHTPPILLIDRSAT